MKVGIPREVKNHEYRVAITPAGVHELVRNGHEVYIEDNAGLGSSIPNEEYVAAALETVRARTLVGIHDRVDMRMSDQGPDIVLRGAAGMVLATQLGVS